MDFTALFSVCTWSSLSERTQFNLNFNTIVAFAFVSRCPRFKSLILIAISSFLCWAMSFICVFKVIMFSKFGLLEWQRI